MCDAVSAQVDTSFIYNTTTPFGTLDIRIAKSSSRYYYLQENKTFSFREISPGVKTDTYRDMTAWDSKPYSQGNMREKNGSNDSFIMNYRLLFPQSYNKNYSPGYPMIVMMHGAGERGNCWDNKCFWDTRAWRPSTNNPPAPKTSTHELLNNDYNLLHGGSVHLQARNLAGSRLPDDPTMPARAFPGFILYPQNLNGWDINSVQDAIRLIRLVSKKYRIDPNRIYVHGLSNGGIATYEVLKRASWLFAAALPMSAPTEASIINSGQRPAVAHVPLWIFQGGLDIAPTPSRTQGYIKSFRDAGAVVRYSEYSNLGHGVWNMAYAEPEFFSWMLKKNKANIHVFAGVSAICGTNSNGVRMELAAGFFRYEWQKNGVTITGATGPKFVATSPGTYRARFSRKRNPGVSDWNRWSDPVTVTTQSIVKPVITQTGSVVLPGLNNYGSAHLRSQGTFANYYWYKNGVKQNLPNAQEVKISGGSGVYSLKVAGPDNCLSAASDNKYVFFNNEAPVNITAPASFTGSALSGDRVSLKWTDPSSTENGFEVWRRRKTGTTTFSQWEMAPIAPRNAVSMTDVGLVPASTYQYKIRAVGDAGRSNYTPSDSNQFLVVVTSGDSQSPTVPQQLTAQTTGIRKIQLQWKPSTDNSGIKEYQIYYGSTIVATGSTATSHTLSNLPLNTNFNFTVRAKDLGNNLSGASNAASASTFVSGLFYQHTTGAFTDIDLINWSIAEYQGKVANFTLSPRTQEDYFNFQFEGYLYINTSGSYQFQTTSDDGSRLTIDNVLAVDNDGLHGSRTITSPALTLNAGGRLINVKYFENSSGQILVVRYNGPDTGNAWQVIPDAALRSGTPPTTALAFEGVDNAGSLSSEKPAGEDMLMEFYPNPSRPGDDITLHVNGQKESVNIKLIDLMGKSYYDNTISAGEYASGIQITPRQQLTKGIYIILVQQGSEIRKQTLIVND